VIILKRLISPILIIALLMVSFYYTNKSVNILKNADPIMKEIKNTEVKYKIAPINAKIIGKNMISGKNGKTIDYEESYNKMKRYGTYNESLTTLKELEPVISIKDNYDKYLVGGNKANRNIALIFKAYEDTDITTILSVLEKKEVTATFFIDGLFLEENTTTLKKMSNHELELLSYNSTYEETVFKTSLSYLESLTKQHPKYCYTEEENTEILSLCKKLKLHTIKPTLVIKKNLYTELKENLSNSLLVSIDINKLNQAELSPTIDYLKKKGYQIVSINSVLKEEN